MFNNSLRKEALKIHEGMLEEYNQSYENMSMACERLYNARMKSIDLIMLVERVINSIANTPKEFNTQLGKIHRELIKFHETEEYAKEAYDASLKAGASIVGSSAAALGFASMAPNALMSIATTFGTASTGTAISALSGAAAQKAAMAWIGRTFAGFAVKEGAGMAAGKAFLAFAGPVGWGISAVSTGISLISLSNKNKEISDKAIKEAKEMAEAREALDETTFKVTALDAETNDLLYDIDRQKNNITSLMNVNYISLSKKSKLFLGTLVNNTLSLSMLLNKTIE